MLAEDGMYSSFWKKNFFKGTLYASSFLNPVSLKYKCDGWSNVLEHKDEAHS